VFLRKGTIDNYEQQGGDLNYIKILDPVAIYEPKDFGRVSFFLRADSQHEIFYASKFTFTDLLAEMGGMYTSLHHILFATFTYFARKMYKFAMIRKLYSYETLI
jgi:hypothetical protein